MPRYFFHLRNGVDEILDPEGRQVASVAALAPQALDDARSLISQDALDGEINMEQRIDVEDGDGRIVCTVRFADAVRIIHAL